MKRDKKIIIEDKDFKMTYTCGKEMNKLLRKVEMIFFMEYLKKSLENLTLKDFLYNYAKYNTSNVMMRISTFCRLFVLFSAIEDALILKNYKIALFFGVVSLLNYVYQILIVLIKISDDNRSNFTEEDREEIRKNVNKKLDKLLDEIDFDKISVEVETKIEN